MDARCAGLTRAEAGLAPSCARRAGRRRLTESGPGLRPGRGDAGEVGAKAKRKPKGAADQTDATKAPEISTDELRAEIQRQKGIAQEFIDKANRLEQKFSEAVEEVTRLDRELAAAKAKAMPEKKSSKPRKPFSVTGLSGFHAGGDRVTLFLDRRLHAKSITLPADKLHQLAEMARAA